MNEKLSATELAESWDITKGFKKTDRNNLQLSEQIQFSRILKVLVSPPEKVLEEAQGPAKPFEPHSEPKKAEAPGDPLSNLLDRVADDLNNFAPPPPADAEPAPAPVAQDNGPIAKEEPVEKPKMRPDQSKDDLAGQDLPEEAAFQVAAAVQGNKTQPKMSEPISQLVQKITAPVKTPGPVNGQTALNNLSSALTSKDFTDVAADLYAASSNKTKSAPVLTTATSAASALARQQSHALSEKLGSNAQALINVNVKPNGTKMRAVPSQNLTPGALLTGSGFGGETSLSTAGQANAFGADPDKMGHGLTNAKPNAPALGQTVQQENATNFGQAVRAQAAAISAQQAANAANMNAKPQPVAIETGPTNTVTAPAQPNPITQAAKVAPPTPPRPLPQPQAPAEQIAVNINKAIGAGADKINIKLNPASLGAIEVKLEIGKDGHISALITAERPETLDLLQRDARGLQRALLDVGLTTDQESLNFHLRGEAQAEAGKNDKTNNHNAKPSEGEEDGDDADHKDGAEQQSASEQGQTKDGRVDIRV